MNTATNLPDNLDELDFQDDLPGVELEEDIVDNPAEPSHDHICELDDDTSLSDLLQERRPSSWISRVKTVSHYVRRNPARAVFDGILHEGFFTVFVGADGSGKSTLGLKIAHAVANGLPLLGRQPEPRPVLYLDRENPQSAVDERMRWMKSWDGGNLTYLGLHTPEGVPWLTERKGKEAIYDWVDRQKKRPLIVVDSLLRFLPDGANPNVDETSEAFFKLITPLKAVGCSFLVYMHTGKGETTQDGKGTKDWTASCDIKYKIANDSPSPTKLEKMVLHYKRSRRFDESIPEKTRIYFNADGDVTLGKTKTDDEKQDEAPAAGDDERLRSILVDNPDGVGTERFEKLGPGAGVAQKVARDWLKAMVAAGTVVQRKKGVLTRHFLAEMAPDAVHPSSEGLLPAKEED